MNRESWAYWSIAVIMWAAALISGYALRGQLTQGSRPTLSDHDGLLRASANAIELASLQVMYVHVTYYTETGSPTYSGEWPHEGTAGCSADIPLGTIFELANGRVVRCNDRGYDDAMAPHIDVFCDQGEDCDAIPGVQNWQVAQPVMVLSWGGS